MLNARIESLIKIAIGIAFLIGAGRIAWLGRTYESLSPTFMVPVMCMMVAFTFSMTAFALILRSDE